MRPWLLAAGVAALSLCVACQGEPEQQAPPPPTSQEQEWPTPTLEHYNPYRQTNAEACPQIPGVFFETADGRGSTCVTFLPPVGEHTTVLGNPSYRYSVPVARDESGEPRFEVLPEHLERCQRNGKIAYLARSLADTHSLGLAAGKATVALPNAADIVSDGIVCRVTLTRLRTTAHRAPRRPATVRGARP